MKIILILISFILLISCKTFKVVCTDIYTVKNNNALYYFGGTDKGSKELISDTSLGLSYIDTLGLFRLKDTVEINKWGAIKNYDECYKKYLNRIY